MTPRVVVAVVVFDRFQNIKEWIRCWSMCETTNAELVIIHNYPDEEQRESFREYCLNLGVRYIPRINVGYDIGAFQDVCNNRLDGFPDYEYLIWCCDDLIPMRKDFIKQYIDKFKEANIGCAALEISPSVRRHIRTTGFCIPKHVAGKLQFLVDPITTKEDCYKFEHRGNTQIFYDQVIRMGLKVVQVSPINTACFWDSGFKRYRSREKEHYQLFPKPSQLKGKIAFICPVYNSYPEIISSLINQSHKDWHLFLVHDGPSSIDIQAIVNATKDSRITYTETPERRQNWGHPIRREYLEKIKDSDFDYVVITNGDNYYTPSFCEYMLKGFTNGQVACYSGKMGHSYIAWGVIECKPLQGYIDCGNVMVRKDVACEIGWNDTESHSSDWLYFNDIIKKYGVQKFAKVEGLLFIHN